LVVGSGCALDPADELDEPPGEELDDPADLADMDRAFTVAVQAAGGDVLYQPANPALAQRLAIEPLAIEVAAIGDPLPGFGDLTEATEAFAAEEEIDEGLGPIFNETGCGVCHGIPVLGGAGTQIERRFGRISNGVFDALEGQGGSLRDLFSNGTYTTETGQRCTIPVEAEPSNANVRNVGRTSIPLFGLGLMDAMPDEVFAQVQATQPPEDRGITTSVVVALADTRDPRQGNGTRRLSRFGWKGGVPSLTQFSADAYMNEMGITTQSCVDGVSNLAFANEQFPNNIAPPAGCQGGDLAPLHGIPGIPQFTDDPVGSCAGGRDEVQDDLILFTLFMTSLAPPPRDLTDPARVQRGANAFDVIGCDDCHVTGTYITPFNPFNGVPARFGFRPFTDFMIHDMGSLGDNIANTGQSATAARRMRTAPLWGVKHKPNLLHDGRANSTNLDQRLTDAILAHAGQAQGERDNFVFFLSSTGRADLLFFLKSL
jgi:CxxC motif-containing protein (DUF1111 family)